MSLAVESAGRFGSTESKLSGTEVQGSLLFPKNEFFFIKPEVAPTLTVLLPALLVHARPVLLPDRVAGRRAEGGSQVAAGGKESSQVGNADRLLTALAFTCRRRNVWEVLSSC